MKEELKNIRLHDEEEETLTWEEKYQRLEKLVETLLKQEKKIFGRVKAGPHIRQSPLGSIPFYRVSVGGDDLMYDLNPLMTDIAVDQIEIGSEVVCLANSIISVSPKELQLKPEPPQFHAVTWADIGGLEKQIAEIRDSIETPLKHKKLATELGLNPISGILLFGPPGTGKTLIAKAIASELLKGTNPDARSFVYLKGGEILSKYVGEAERRIKQTFDACREYMQETNNPAIIFLDEADAVLRKRGSGISSDVGKTIVPTFLAEMDGMHINNPIVILSTNTPKALDPAVIREGRVDLKIPIRRPNRKEFETIMNIHLKKVKVHDSVSELAMVAAEAVFENERIRTNVNGGLAQVLTKKALVATLKRVTNGGSKKMGILMEDLDLAIKEVTNE